MDYICGLCGLCGLHGLLISGIHVLGHDLRWDADHKPSSAQEAAGILCLGTGSAVMDVTRQLVLTKVAPKKCRFVPGQLQVLLRAWVLSAWYTRMTMGCLHSSELLAISSRPAFGYVRLSLPFARLPGPVRWDMEGTANRREFLDVFW